MNEAQTDDPARLGLRERKKAKTRALIQAEALRLFKERGYDETSIEQIAEAAEVSPSTVFRYFPTKPDLVLYDDLDDAMVEAFRAQPPDLGATEALRTMFKVIFAGLPAEDIELQRERGILIQQVPELRAAMLDDLLRTMQELVDMIAERSGRPASDPAVETLAGAVMGVAIGAWFGSPGENWIEGFVDRMDNGMAMLQSGIRL